MNKGEIYTIEKDETITMLLTVMAAVFVAISLTVLSQQALAQTASSYEYRLTIETLNGEHMQPFRDTRLYIENIDTGYYQEQTFVGGYPGGGVYYFYDYQMPVGSEFQVCFGYDDSPSPIRCESYIRGSEYGEYVELSLAP